MLGLEQRPDEPSARSVFLNVRSQAFKSAVKTFKARLPDLDRKSLEKLASFTIALADGFFISQQVADKTIDLMKHHELQAAAILGVINHLQLRPLNLATKASGQCTLEARLMHREGENEFDVVHLPQFTSVAVFCGIVRLSCHGFAPGGGTHAEAHADRYKGATVSALADFDVDDLERHQAQ